MDLGLRGKAAAVMAGSEGIGRAAAMALAAEGANVAICGRREDVLRSTAKQIADATGSKVFPIVADVSDPRDVERFVNAAAADLRGLDVLVVNAGGPPPGKFEQVTDDHWQAAFDLTVMSAVRAVRHALPHFRAERGGSVVAVQSTSVKQPIEHLLLSSSLRLAVVGLFKALATEYGREGVRFNVVLPGSIATDRQTELAQVQAADRGVSIEQVLAERAKSIPFGFIGEPADLGDAIAWLASDRARYVNGAVLQVDGGLIRSPL
jgi:3-oxoacyl-[acyl-carrier protein] reductase